MRRLPAGRSTGRRRSTLTIPSAWAIPSARWPAVAATTATTLLAAFTGSSRCGRWTDGTIVATVIDLSHTVDVPHRLPRRTAGARRRA